MSDNQSIDTFKFIPNHANRLRDPSVLPVHVTDIAKELATVCFDNIPGDISAIVIGPKSPNPTILIQKNHNKFRVNFSLAHELGHIKLPWHPSGTIVCTPTTGESNQVDSVGLIEREADAFAAELLVPSSWVRAIVQQSNTLDEVWKEVRRADVACITLARSIISQCPPNTACYVYHKGNKAFKGTSPGTVCYFEDFSVDQIGLLRHKSTLYSHISHPANYEIIFVGIDSEMGDKKYTYTDSRVLLKKILIEAVGLERMPAALRQINGIIGSANSKFKTNSIENLQENITLRLKARVVDLGPFIEHPDFMNFIYSRAVEIKQRK